MDAVAEYLVLGLRFGRLDPDLVEECTAGSRLPRRVAAEPRPDPLRLVADARRLRAGLAGSGLAAARAEFLAAQLDALEFHGLRMAGRAAPPEEEAATCFQVRPHPGDPELHRRVHAELAGLLPGPGAAATRLDRLRAAERVEPRELPAAVRALSAALRARVRARIGLPAQESVRYRFAPDGRASGVQRYRGDFRSLVLVDTGRERWAGQLPALVAHEAYPGHHAESCLREAELVDRLGHREHAIALRGTPQSLLSEGLAEVGLRAAAGPGWGPWAAEVLAGAGVRLDGALAERVRALLAELGGARWDAAVLLHGPRPDPEAAVRHLRGAALMPEPAARALVRHLADPRHRARTAAYVEGRRVVGGWLAAGGWSPERVRRLLREPWTPAGLARDVAGTVRGCGSLDGDR